MCTQRWAGFSPINFRQYTVKVSQRHTTYDVGKSECFTVAKFSSAEVFFHRCQPRINLLLLFEVPFSSLSLWYRKTFVVRYSDCRIYNTVSKRFPALYFNAGWKSVGY